MLSQSTQNLIHAWIKESGLVPFEEDAWQDDIALPSDLLDDKDWPLRQLFKTDGNGVSYLSPHDVSMFSCFVQDILSSPSPELPESVMGEAAWLWSGPLTDDGRRVARIWGDVESSLGITTIQEAVWAVCFGTSSNTSPSSFQIIWLSTWAAETM